MLSFWLASGLGFALNHIEQAFDKLFSLAGEPIEFCKLDTAALLRSDRKDRIESLARAVQAGILSPNEARNQEGFDDVPFGFEPRAQMQMVPLSAAGSIPSAPGPEAPPAASAANYQAAVRSDVEALRTRASRPERTAAFDEAAKHAPSFGKQKRTRWPSAR